MTSTIDTTGMSYQEAVFFNCLNAETERQKAVETTRAAIQAENARTGKTVADRFGEDIVAAVQGDVEFMTRQRADLYERDPGQIDRDFPNLGISMMSGRQTIAWAFTLMDQRPGASPREVRNLRALRVYGERMCAGQTIMAAE